MKNLVTLEEMLPVMEEILNSGGSVTFTPNGSSMKPMLSDGKDTITLEKPESHLKKYDLPLYKRENGSFVLHRVTNAENGVYTMRGDNQIECEYGINHSQIIGVVTRFTRNGKEHTVNDFFYKLYVTLWCSDLNIFLKRVKRKLLSYIK